MSAKANAIPLPASDQLLSPTQKILYGWTIRSTAATGVTNIRNGSATGTILGTIDLPTAATSTVWYGDEGLRAPDGIFVDRVSGTLEGSIFVG